MNIENESGVKELAAALMREMGKPQAPSITLRELATIYLERHAKPHKKDWKPDESRLRLYILPAFGDRQLCSITSADVLSFQASICASSENKSKASAKGKYAANRCLEQLGQMFRLARDWGYYPEDKRIPTEKVKCFTERPRERFVDASEMERLGKAIDRVKKRAPHLRALFLLNLMTGLRRDELRTARWDDLDLAERQLRRSGVSTKSGKPLCQPLSPEACEMLDELPRRSPYIFCAKGQCEPVSVTTVFRCWSRVRKAANLSDVRIHDLRRTTGSWLAQAGCPLPLVGKALNHNDLRSTEIYARFSNADVRRALDTHSSKLARYIPNVERALHPTRKQDAAYSVRHEEGAQFLPECVPSPCMPSLAKAIDECAPHLRAFFWLFMMTGLSKAELLSARWQELNEAASVLTIRAEYAHTRKTTAQPVSAAALNLFAALPRHSAYVFASPGKARAISPPSLRDAWESICRRAHLPGFEIRTLRRTAERLMIEDGVHPDLVAKVFNRKPKGRAEFSQEEILEAIDSLSTKIRELAEHTSTSRIE